MSGAERAQRVAEYLVYLALAGKQAELKAVYMYYVKHMSPSEIECELLLLPRTMLCGYIGRVREKAGGHQLAEQVVAALYPKLRNAKPAVRQGQLGYWWCELCKRFIAVLEPAQHVSLGHRREVSELASRLLREAGLAP